MQRRTLIKQMVYVTAGALVLPSCLQQTKKPFLSFNNINVDSDGETLMAELCETILPATDTPGAKDLSAHLFTFKMVDDCYKKEDQEKFLNGLKAFVEKSKKDFGKSFAALSPAEKQTLLNALESAGDAKEPMAYFYSTTKKHTAQAYTTSKFYLTKVQVYKLVPGRYRGCVSVNKIA